MAANPIPKGVSELLTMAEDCAEGVHDIGAAVGVVQNTEAKILADMDSLRSTQQAFKDAQNAQAGFRALQKAADKAGRVFLVAARRRLVAFLGGEYTPAWGVAGFGPNSTGVPESVGGRQQLLEVLKDYFPAHAAQEDAALNITGARAGVLYESLKETRFNVSASETVVDNAQDDRDAAHKALERRVRGLIGELEQLLAPDADEWATFNLNAPADPDTPEESEAPVVFARGGGQIEVRIELARRADYNHVFTQRIGVDIEPVRYDGQFFPPNAVLTGLALGETNVTVCGVNEAGSGPVSPPTLVTVS